MASMACICYRSLRRAVAVALLLLLMLLLMFPLQLLMALLLILLVQLDTVETVAVSSWFLVGRCWLSSCCSLILLSAV